MPSNTLMSRLLASTAVLLSASVVAQAAGPERVRNAFPYRVSKEAAATGRSGSAQIQARALLGKDKATVLEVTTGVFDGATAPPRQCDQGAGEGL